MGVVVAKARLSASVMFRLTPLGSGRVLLQISAERVSRVAYICLAAKRDHASWIEGTGLDVYR
jgi:predicted RNA-binding protein YlxR (DUF448 family)